jgi:hypothetical protein
MRTLGRFIFWDFPRASWQYDVMVALILAFVFAVPRDFFKDQPRPMSVSMLHDGSFLLDSQILNGVPEGPERDAKAARALLDSRYRNRGPVTSVDPVYDSEHQIIGYAVTVKP